MSGGGGSHAEQKCHELRLAPIHPRSGPQREALRHPRAHPTAAPDAAPSAAPKTPHPAPTAPTALRLSPAPAAPDRRGSPPGERPTGRRSRPAARRGWVPAAACPAPCARGASVTSAVGGEACRGGCPQTGAQLLLSGRLLAVQPNRWRRWRRWRRDGAANKRTCMLRSGSPRHSPQTRRCPSSR
jgi:hypothetical protein